VLSLLTCDRDFPIFFPTENGLLSLNGQQAVRHEVPSTPIESEKGNETRMTPQKKKSLLILIMFMVAHAVNDGFGWIIPPLLPAIREYFNLSYTEMGAFYTLYRFTGSVFQAPASYLVYLAPISLILAVGLLWSSIGMYLVSMSSSYGMLLGVSAISGIGRSTYHPLAVTILSRLFGRESFGRALALHLSASGAGMVIAPFLVGLLLTRFNWRLPLQVWSILGIMTGLSLLSFLRSQRQDLQPKTKALRWPFFSHSVGIYLLAASIWGVSQSGLMAFIPLFLVDHRRFSKQAAAAAYGIMAFSGTVCRPFLGTLMDRMGSRKPVIVGGFIVASISILGMATIDNLLMLYPIIVLIGVFGSGHGGLADTLLIEMIPSQRREETLGFYYTMRMGIASLSPVMVGWASERISLPNCFLGLALVAGLSALLLSMIKERPIE
jgi:FSR family fosmidomycin resistance protein-like MFS transporter